MFARAGIGHLQKLREALSDHFQTQEGAADSALPGKEAGRNEVKAWLTKIHLQMFHADMLREGVTCLRDMCQWYEHDTGLIDELATALGMVRFSHHMSNWGTTCL